MVITAVSSYEYSALLMDRLPGKLAGARVPFDVFNESVIVPAIPAAAACAADLIVTDVRPLELIRLAELLPKDLREDGRVVVRAEELTRGAQDSLRAVSCILAYMEEEREMIIEGFLRFRLQYLLDEWAAALDRAAEEISFLRLF